MTAFRRGDTVQVRATAQLPSCEHGKRGTVVLKQQDMVLVRTDDGAEVPYWEWELLKL